MDFVSGKVRVTHHTYRSVHRIRNIYTRTASACCCHPGSLVINAWDHPQIEADPKFILSPRGAILDLSVFPHVILSVFCFLLSSSGLYLPCHPAVLRCCAILSFSLTLSLARSPSYLIQTYHSLQLIPHNVSLCNFTRSQTLPTLVIHFFPLSPSSFFFRFRLFHSLSLSPLTVICLSAFLVQYLSIWTLNTFICIPCIGVYIYIYMYVVYVMFVM